MAYKNNSSPEAKASRAKHYRNNKEQYLRRNRELRERMQAHIRALKNAPCMDCKNNYPYYVMDFDHRDPAQKKGLISQLVKKGSWEKLKEEIEKCDIVCANCHRIRTYSYLLAI